MSRRERDTRVRLDRMTDEQIEILRRNVFGALVGKAGDLRLLNKNPDPKGADQGGGRPRAPGLLARVRRGGRP
jgi:hypothetical protein